MKANIRKVGENALPAFLNHGKGGEGRKNREQIIYRTQHIPEIKILDSNRSTNSSDYFPCTKASHKLKTFCSQVLGGKRLFIFVGSNVI